MKRGLEYAFSAEKRALDLAAAAILTPPAKMTELILRNLLRGQPDEDNDPLFQQDRVGASRALFVINKLRTLDRQTLQPLNGVTSLFRRFGIDELWQARNIRRGEMSLVGHRPLPPDLDQAIKENAPGKLVDKWKRLVEPTRPGMLSTFAIVNHREPEAMVARAELKLEVDIKDVVDGSLAYDRGIVAKALRAAARGET